MVGTSFLLLWAGLAGAEPAPEPVLHVEVDGPLEVDLETRVGRGRGRIQIRKGAFRICCARVEVRYGPDGIDRATCREQVAIAYGDDVRGTAEEARWADDRFHLEGRVTLWAPSGRLTGDHLVFDPSDRRLRLTGRPSRWDPAGSAPEARPACPAP